MSLRFTVIFPIFFLFACTHSAQISVNPSLAQTDSTQNLPFMFVPMDSVTWHVHCQGTTVFDSNGSHWDSSFHLYTTITSTGQSARIGSRNYFIFKTFSYTNTYRNWWDTGLIYLREDTGNKKVYSTNYYVNTWEPEVLVLDYNLTSSTVVNEFYRWPQTIINAVDSIIVDKKYVKNGVFQQRLAKITFTKHMG